eukprot:Clim_evm45s225 gene=Clim_evmTU45s225
MTAPSCIAVAVRVRPLKPSDPDAGRHVWDIQGRQLSLILEDSGGRSNTFHANHVYGPESQTDKIYQELASPIVEGSLEGFNGTIFAYGQTSSGKTHTMHGNPECPGITIKALRHIFQLTAASQDREYLLRVSYMEIYNENIRDLLEPRNSRNLKISENYQREVQVSNLTERVVSNPLEAMETIRAGEVNRTFGETNMNERSSRAHTIFRIVVESRKVSEGTTDKGAVRMSSLSLVDLAGSERVSLTGAEGERLKEGQHINKSLLALGRVISRLAEKASFIPYRDSKITRILQNSLGGNARTAVICTVNPKPCFVDESVSTLKFASRAMSIENRPTINEVETEGAMIRRYRKEIDALKKRINELEGGSVIESDSIDCASGESNTDKDAEVPDMDAEEEITFNKERLRQLTRALVGGTLGNRSCAGGTSGDKVLDRRITIGPGTLPQLSPSFFEPKRLPTAENLEHLGSIEHFERMKRESDEHISDLLAKISEQKEDLLTASQRINQEKSERKLLKQKVSALEARCSALHSDLEAVKQQGAPIAAVVDVPKVEDDSAALKVAQAGMQLKQNELTHEVNVLRVRCSDLESNLAKAKENAASMHRNAQQQGEEMLKREEQVQELKDMITEWKKGYADLKSELEERTAISEKTISVLKSEVKHKEDKLTEHRGFLELGRDRILELESTINELEQKAPAETPTLITEERAIQTEGTAAEMREMHTQTDQQEKTTENDPVVQQLKAENAELLSETHRLQKVQKSLSTKVTNLKVKLQNRQNGETALSRGPLSEVQQN